MAQVSRRLRVWLDASVRRKLLVSLALSLIVASLCFLALLLGTYRSQLLQSRAAASMEINRLLHSALENAMLKRDIDGLREMVAALGKQDRIANVMILSPTGETRFASDERMLGRRFDLAKGELCPGCAAASSPTSAYAALTTDHFQGDVLRSVNPVQNREACLTCHGKTSENPINGILVVDYEAAQIRHEIRRAMLALSAAGVVVLLAGFGTIGWMVNRSILAPLQRLTRTADEVRFADLGKRFEAEGNDELAKVGSAFNAMADRIADGARLLGARERLLQSMIDAMPDGVRVIDRNYRVVKANAAFCQQQMKSLDEVLGEPCYRSSHGRSAPCAWTLVTCPLHQIGLDTAALTCRHRHVRSDGTELHVEVSAAPCNAQIEGAQGPLIVEVIRDISKDIQVSHEQRLSEIGLLAAGVAHEIHNPLASIHLGFASINRELANGRYENVSRYVHAIDEEIARCIDVTSRLLKLSAPPSDHLELVVLDQIVPEVLSLLSAEAEQRQIILRSSFAGSTRVLGADAELRMLTLNMAQNAIHAMPDGGELVVIGELEGSEVKLTFKDTGTGIAAADLPRIFDPFWSRRGDGSKGTGLGLPICREIVGKLGGSIAVESIVGEGTSFVVRLTSADAETQS